MPDHLERTFTSSSTDSETLASGSLYGSEKEYTNDLQIRDSHWWRDKWRMLFILPALVIIAVVVPMTLYLQTSFQNLGPFGCDPAGNLWVAGSKTSNSVSLWNPAYTLSPTLIVWKTSFTYAKAADICWDVFVGRGYSALCAALVYSAFRVVLAEIMKTNPLPQGQLLAAQYSMTSVVGLRTFMKDCTRLFRGRALPLRIHIIMVQLTAFILYVLITPTWLSAMTSYQATTYPVFKTDNNYTALENLISCRFRIADGHRVGLPDNVCIPPSGFLYNAVQNYMQSDPGIQCYGEITMSRDEYGDESREYTAAGFDTASLPRKSCDYDSAFDIDGNVTHLPKPVLNLSGVEYAYEGHPINATVLQSRSICQSSQSGEYEWGFSFLLLFSFTLVTIVLMLAISLLWMRYYSRIWPQQVDLVFGDIRTALIVGTSVRELLGDKVDGMSEKEIKKRLSQMDSGVQQSHTRSEIMSVASPCNSRPKPDSRFPVGSNAYKNYIVHGYESVRQTWNLCDLEVD